MFDQYGNQSFGYSHPEILAAIAQKLETRNLNSTKIMFEEDQILLATEIAAATGNELSCTYFSNGGGEAIDNALKLARAYTRRAKVISAAGCFHGKTFGALSASERHEHRSLFEPLLPDFLQVPFDDVAALESAVDKDTAAVLLEPVQAEAGVRVPDAKYLQAAREICTRHGALLIFDEMQTAFGRLGTLFAFQSFNVVPDVICMGKAFGGGIVALSAIVARPQFWGLLAQYPSTFGSSLGGNPLSCAVGRAVLRIAARQEFLQQVRYGGETISERMDTWVQRFPRLLSAHRGMGMMHGLEFRESCLAGMVLHLLYVNNVSSTYSLYDSTVLRVQPPMTITADELRNGLNIIERVLEAAQLYVDRWPALTRGESVVESRCELEVETDALLRTLHARPSLFDPFSRNPAGQRGDWEPHFNGTLASEPLVWSDSLEWSSDGLVARSSGQWPWVLLRRQVSVRPIGRAGACELRLRIEWDGGTGSYEPMVAGCVALFVLQRLPVVIREAITIVQNSLEPHPDTTSAIR